MDNVFKANEQRFISNPLSFRRFLDISSELSASWASAFEDGPSPFPEQSAAADRRVKTIANKLNKCCASCAIDYDNYGNVQTDTIPSFQHSALRTLDFIKVESILRRNAQYKSAALRTMKYDGVNAELLMMPRKEGSERAREKENTEDDNAELLKQTSGTKECGDGRQARVDKLETRSPTVSSRSSSPVLLDADNGTTFAASTSFSCNNNIGNSHADMDLLVADEVVEVSTSLKVEDNLGKESGLIANVSIYLGYNRCLEKAEQRLGRLLKVTHRLLVLGSNTLSDLKRIFFCPVDYNFSIDAMEQLPKLHDMHKYRFPSSFFFIGDTFYIDQQGLDPSGIPLTLTDLSEPVREWAKARPNFGELKVAAMHETKIIDIVCRIGQPFVYVHQGTCEHLVCFTDLRLRSYADPSGPYPIPLVERKFRRKLCRACNTETAEWIVKGNAHLPSNSFYICSICLIEFNFDAKKRPIGKFKLIPYCDREALSSESDVYTATIIQRLEQIGKLTTAVNGQEEGGDGLQMKEWEFPGGRKRKVRLNENEDESGEQKRKPKSRKRK